MARQSFVNATRRARLLFAAALFATLAALLVSPASRAQDARPRRANTTQQPARPTPTPARAPSATPQPAATAQAPQSPSPEQSQPQQGASPAPPQLKGQEVGDDDVLTVDTNLVNLHVRVIDRNNRPVSDVRQDEFRVFEDGVPQKIEFFSKEEVPISYGLVVDNSGSMKPLLGKVIDATKILIDQNKPGDETFLLRFVDSDDIKLLQDFTDKKDDLYDALDDMHTNGGQTAIIDAVYLAAEHTAEYKKNDALGDKRRRAMILITDGEDRSSYYKLNQLFEYLRENDVQIYVIGFTSELDAEGGFIRKSPKDKATELINRLATETGGRAFFPASLSDLPGIAEEITRDMRTQYVIGYYPTNRAKDGAYHSIRVSVADAPGRDKRIALTRSGRTASREGAQPAKPPAKPAAGKTATTRSQ